MNQRALSTADGPQHGTRFLGACLFGSVAMSKAAFAGLKAVQEIRFHLCQTSKGSEGVSTMPTAGATNARRRVSRLPRR